MNTSSEDMRGSIRVAPSRPPHPFSSALWGKPSVSRMLYGLTCIALLRTALELLLGPEHNIAFDLDFYDTLLMWAHLYISWLCLFVFMALVAAVFLQIALFESLKLVVMVSPLITIVPIIDFFADNSLKITYSGNFADFIYNYVNLFNPKADIRIVTTGVRIEVFIATISAVMLGRFGYHKGWPRSILLAFSMYSGIFAFGYLPAWTPEMPSSSVHQSFFCLYLPVVPLLAILLLIKLRKEDPQKFEALMHLLYPRRLVFYIFLMTWGAVFTANAAGSSFAVLTSTLGTGLFLSSISIIFLFMYAKLQNDIHDIEIDRVSNSQRPTVMGLMPPETASSIGSVCLILSSLFALASGHNAIVLWLVIFILCALYSEPPMRLRRFYPIGHCLLSMIGTAVFLLGASLAEPQRFFGMERVRAMTGCIFVIFFCLSHLKDLKDIHGDKQGGVGNVYNMTPLPKLAGVFVICGFCASLVITLQALDIGGPAIWIVLLGYFVASIASILLASELRRLDWIMTFSLIPICHISIAWFIKSIK